MARSRLPVTVGGSLRSAWAGVGCLLDTFDDPKPEGPGAADLAIGFGRRSKPFTFLLGYVG